MISTVCTDGYEGYIPTAEAFAQGGYAALESTYLYRRLPVEPGEAERLGEALGEALKSILAEG